MTERVSIAALTFVAGLLLALLDAVLLQRLEPRDRIGWLVIYAALPALAAAVAELALRARSHRLIAAAAAIVPPSVAWVTGESTAAAAFDRLAMAPFWFGLRWLPIAVAIGLVWSAPMPRSGHRRPFGLPLWRFGLVFVLLFVAATFSPKNGAGVEVSAFTGVTVFIVLLFGCGLLLAAAVPSQFEPAVLEWTAFILAFLLIVATATGSFYLADRIGESDSIRETIAFSRDAMVEVETVAARHESRGTLTETDRQTIQRYKQERQAGIAELHRQLQQQPLRIASAVLLLVAALVPALLFSVLFVSLFRNRRASGPRAREAQRIDRASMPAAPGHEA